MASDKKPGDKLLYCSFCGKSQHEVRKLIAGPTVFICDECVELCNDIIREEIKGGIAARKDGAVLADHVLVEDLEDFLGLGKVAARGMGLLLEFFADDVVAQLDAFIADEHAGARDQLAHLMLALAAEGAVQDLAAVAGAAALSIVGHAYA